MKETTMKKKQLKKRIKKLEQRIKKLENRIPKTPFEKKLDKLIWIGDPIVSKPYTVPFKPGTARPQWIDPYITWSYVP